jgi:tetratricopeptide (TPR) repeat protein
MTLPILATLLLAAAPATHADDDSPPGALAQSVVRLMDDGRFADAEALLRSLGDRAPRMLRARCAAGQGRYAEAAKLLEAEAATRGARPDPRSDEGWWLAAARWKAPPEALAHHARGFWLVNQGRFSEARSELEEALRLAPGLADARYHLGYALSQLDETDAAEREYRAAIAGYGPGERVLLASAQYGLGALLARSGPYRAPEAIALLLKAMAPDGHGRLAGILYQYAQALRASGNVKGARAALAEALEADGQLPDEVAEDVGWDFFTEGCRPRPRGAAPGVPPACAPEPASKSAETARETQEAHQPEAAAAKWRAALRADPGYALAHLGLGMALADQQKWTEAEPAFRAALAMPRMRSLKATAAIQRMLGFTLVKRAVRSTEALLLLLDSEAVARDDSERAWFALQQGQAFALAGLPACARLRLRSVHELPAAPEPIRAAARQALANIEATTGPTRDDCFDYERYRPTTLGQETARYRREHPPERESGVQHRTFHPPERYRVHVEVDGGPTPLPEGPLSTAGGMFKAFGETSALAEKPGGAVREQVVVQEGKTRFTLPVTADAASALRARLPKGGSADLFVMLLGAIDGQVLLVVLEALPAAVQR